MKKAGKILALTFISLIFVSVLASFVAAADWGESVASFIESAGKAAQPIFDLIQGQGAHLPGEGTIIILTFILIALLIYSIMSTVNIFGERNWINVAIGLIVAFIGVRVLPEGFLMQMAIPSGALAGGILLVIPFIIIGVMLERINNPLVRRVLWAIYGVLIAALWAYNVNNTGMKPIIFLYPVLALAAFLAFFFDSIVHKIWKSDKNPLNPAVLGAEKAVEELEKRGSSETARNLDELIKGLQKDRAYYAKLSIDTGGTYDGRVKEIDKQIAKAQKDLAAALKKAK